MNRHERRRQGKLTTSFIPLADTARTNEAQEDFKRNTLKPHDLAVMTSAKGQPVNPIISVDTSNRPDLTDLVRIHFDETGGAGLDVRTTWAFMINTRGASYARLEIEVFRPVKTTAKILFDLDKPGHRKFLKAVSESLLPAITIDFEDQPPERSFISFEIEQDSLRTFFARYVRPEAA